jgi:hypothetical protein
MKHVLIAVAALASSTAFAMPCDTGFTCISDSGKYVVELQSCRYVNAVSLVSVKVEGKALEGASLGPAYDGTIDGGPLAVEIELPLSADEAANGSARVLTIEVAPGSEEGTIKEKFVEEQPGPYAVVASEKVTCTQE